MLLGATAEEYLRRFADTDRPLARQVRELLLLIRDYGPEAVAAALQKAHAARAFGASTSPTFCANNNPGAKSSRLSGSRILNLTNWPPIHSRSSNTTLSSFVPERSSVTPLHTKLNQLSLTTMSHQLDQTISDATGRNLSFPQTLEALADLELEARNARSIERRFRLSRLQAQRSIDSFNFKHHKSRAD